MCTAVAVFVFFFYGHAQFNTVPESEQLGKLSVLTGDGPKLMGIDGVVLDGPDIQVASDTVGIADSGEDLSAVEPTVELGRLPLEDIHVTSPFGRRTHPVTGEKGFHYGIDLRARGRVIWAVHKGIVREVDYSANLGKYIIVASGTYEFIYGHLQNIYVARDQIVEIGSALGMTGDSGRVTAEHLHFGIRSSGRYIDPFPILQLLEGTSDIHVVTVDGQP